MDKTIEFTDKNGHKWCELLGPGPSPIIATALATALPAGVTLDGLKAEAVIPYLEEASADLHDPEQYDAWLAKADVDPAPPEVDAARAFINKLLDLCRSSKDSTLRLVMPAGATARPAERAPEMSAPTS